MDRRVLLYELNEVPWSLIDRYTARRPSSTLAAFLDSCASATTINKDPVHLSPWRTWPTFHKSMYTEDHNSYDLGQDPKTFRGLDIWDAVAATGKRVGLFGPMQSWPAKSFPAGGFHVPDTFARRSDTVPARLMRFQRFNLAMTSENGFSSDNDLSSRLMATVGLDLVRHGLAPQSTATLVKHLVRERRDARYKAARPMMQVLPSFDLYWALHRKMRPALSIFFTNHVAGMMHRYWGDAMPDYDPSYKKDAVFGGFVMEAMDLFDRQLARIMRFANRNPETVVVIASSMGQGPIEYNDLSDTYVLEDSAKLTNALGLGAAEERLAMYPKLALQFRDEADVSVAARRLAGVSAAFGPVFRDIRTAGTTITFAINFSGTLGLESLPRKVTVRDDGPAPTSQALDIADLGLSIKQRLGGGNTAYHVPEGIFLARGAGIRVVKDRPDVEVLDVAPYLLELMGVSIPSTMQGDAARMREFQPAPA